MPAARSVEIFEYNAFTDQPFAGNPAAVVVDADGLDERLMQKIARQMNLAETAFLMQPSSNDADVRLRWFTPALEVTLCGHATIAAFTAAVDRGLYFLEDEEERELRVETLSGILRIRITRHEGRPRVAMQIPVPTFETLDVDREGFAAIWSVSADSLAGEWLRHTGLDYWYVPVKDQTALRKLTLNVDELARFDSIAAFTFFTTDTIDSGSDWHIRFFAPFHGVDEDIVTGSAQGPMGVVHLRRTRVESRGGWSEFTGEQGDTFGRPGRVLVRVRHEAGAVSDVEIAGGAVPMLEGLIRI